MHLTPIRLCRLCSSAMLHQTVLGLLLACAVSLSSSAVVLDNGLPMLWSQTASQPSELPIQNDVLMPNPWHFLNRMSLYRLLIAATDPLMGSMGTGVAESPFWGLPLQLAWMLTSGRLVDPTGTTTCGMETGDTMCISTESWWACENYFVSVLPFLSAAQNGFMGDGVQVQMQVPDGVTEYCTTYADCSTRFPVAMSKWDTFFQSLRGISESADPDNVKKDNILGLYWDAQMTSTTTSSACDAKKGHYSAPEVSFANAWLNSAEYVSAAHFQSSLELAAKFIVPLPGRVLKEGDVAPNIEGLSQEENSMLNTFSWLDSINRVMGGTLVSVWRKGMCSVTTREKGRDLLEQVMLTPAYSSISFMGIVTSMATEC
ncbi:protein LEG1 homolog [Notolabrus celidotus]|uniref:protein LEG1 homolog n=1 Tax=Notolabrus celidotus TaxID=1203425 RepID=UPI00148FE1FF|nr:protein LEG1 homolog [Notolabrus celidotus]